MIQFKKILIYLPLVCLLVLTNYLVDPANIFQTNRYEKEAAEILLTGLNLSNISNYDERLLQKYYIQGLTNKTNIIVLGSSRAMQINESLFPGKKFFNHSVSGASLEDYLAILEIYLEKKIKPETIILGLDPWLLNKNNQQKRWRSLAEYHNRFVPRLLSSENFFSPKSATFFRLEKYSQVFSLSYFQVSIRNLFSFEDEKEFFSTDLKESDVATKLADGSFSYDQKYRLQPSVEVLKEAQNYTNQVPVYSLGDYNKLDKKKIDIFEKLIFFLTENNIKLIFFLTPYHPYVYDYLINSTEYKIIAEVETYFNQVAFKNNIDIIGSYNPQNCVFNENDFYDGMHLKKIAMEKLFQDFQLKL